MEIQKVTVLLSKLWFLHLTGNRTENWTFNNNNNDNNES